MSLEYSHLRRASDVSLVTGQMPMAYRHTARAEEHQLSSLEAVAAQLLRVERLAKYALSAAVTLE